MANLIKLKNKIPYGKHYIDRLDKNSVLSALNSGILSNGLLVNKFEEKVNRYLNCKFSVACSSGTAAIHLAFLSLNLKKEDVIILPVINFVAAANILSMMNIKFFFADVDEYTGQLTKETILDCITKNKLKKVKAIVTSYIGGHTFNYEQILNLKKKYKFLLIEDSCHAFGTKYKIKNKNYKIGCAKHSDISTFSFHPLKTITTAEGGLVTTNKRNIYKKIKNLRSHGFIKQKNYWEYDLSYNGLNYRMSEINAALGCSQINKIKKILNKRYEIAKRYHIGLKKIKSIKLPLLDKNSSWHLFILIIDFANIKISKKNLIKKLNKLNIFPQIHYTPTIFFEKFKKHKGQKLSNAENYFNNSLSIPIYYDLSTKVQNIIINNIKLLCK